MTSSIQSRLGTAPEEGCKAPCVVVSTTNITLAGEQTIGGVAVVAGDRVLVSGQTDNTTNGIYNVQTTAWTYAKDWNKANDVVSGVLIPVISPTRIYQVTFSGTFVAGTTAITFTTTVISRIIPFTTMTLATGDTGVLAGDVLIISEISTGSRGFALWNVISGTGTADGYTKIAHDTLSLTYVPISALPLYAETYGADNTGATDSTAALVEANYTQSSEIHLGDGLFKMNKWMELNSIKGNGYSTQLQPFSAVTNDGFVLSLGSHSLPFGAFDLQWVRDLAIDGKTTGCIRFDDEDDVDGADLSSVGWLLENLTLRSLGGGTCVKSEFGTIGNRFNSMNLVGAGYHYWLQNNQFSVQHTGANTWNQGHHQRAERASVYINDNQQGRGSWVFNELIIENNQGFGIFCIADLNTNIINHGALVINNCWFEKNGVMVTGTPDLVTMVDVEGTSYLPQDMRFENFGNIVINATGVKSMDLIASDVACYDCRHDGDNGYYHVTKDKNSTINLTNPSGGGTMTNCDEWSHTAPASIAGFFNSRQPMLRMAHRSVRAPATVRTSMSTGFEKQISGNYTFGAGMTGTQVADGLLFDTCLEATVAANQTTGTAQISSHSVSAGGIDSVAVPVVTGISQANPAVVTVSSGILIDNQLVRLTGVVGMTELNDQDYYTDYIDATHFSLRGVDSTGYTAWSSGGSFTPITSWVVMSVAVKVVSGLEHLTNLRVDNGGTGRIGNLRIGKEGEWVTTVCLINMSTSGIGFSNSSIKAFTAATGSAVIRFCDFQVAAFASKQEASDFIHSGIFEYTSGEELTDTPDTVTDTAACSLTTEQSNLVTTGAATPTLADGFEGQIKTIYHKTFAGAATITPANMHGGTNVATSAAGQGVTFKFTDSKWLLIGNPYNLTIA